MKKLLKLLLVIFIIIISVSCKTAFQAENGKSEKFVIPPYKNLLVNMTDKASISVKSESMANNVMAKISISRSDTAAMNLNGPFGLVIGKLWSTGQDFIFLNVFENSVYKGKPNSEGLGKVLNIKVNFDDFVHFLRGETPYSPDLYQQINDTAKTGILYKYNSSATTADFALISQSDGRLVQYQRKTVDNEVIINAKFSEYRNFSDFDLPGKIILQFPEIESEVIIDVNDIEINKPGFKIDKLEIPGGLRLINLY